jgi:hypothetical protein
MPAVIRRRGPTRLYRRLVSCTPIMPPIASVNVDRPEWTAEKPRPFCSRSGTRNSVPMNPPPAAVSCRLVMRNSRSLYNPRRSIGSATRSSVAMKLASSTRPGSPVPSTAADPQPDDEPVDTPYMSSGKPAAASRKPGRSKRPTRCSDPAGRNSRPMRIAAMPTGRLM